jgi:hypothetical protein
VAMGTRISTFRCNVVPLFSDIWTLEDAGNALPWRGGFPLPIDAGYIPEGRVLTTESVSADGNIC